MKMDFMHVVFVSTALCLATSAMAEPTTLAEQKGLGLSGIKLEVSTLSQVEKAFGKSKLVQKGDAGGAESSRCYLSKDRTQAVYFSSSEVGGGTIVDGISIKTATVFSLKDCSPTSRTFAFTNGMKLGMMAEDISKSLGNPLSMGLNFWGFQFSVDDADRGFTQTLSISTHITGQDTIDEIDVTEDSID
jgi:hypothetical protein